MTYTILHYTEMTRTPELLGTVETIEAARELAAVYVTPWAVTAHDGAKEVGVYVAADETQGKRDMPLALDALRARRLSADHMRIERVEATEAYYARDNDGYVVIRRAQ